MDLTYLFDGLTDPRAKDNQKYSFHYLMLITLCATLSGIDSCVGIQDYAEAYVDFFSSYFKTPFTPRHDTFLELLSKLDNQEMEVWFRKRTRDILMFVQNHSPPTTAPSPKNKVKTHKYRHFCIDGKTIRNSGYNNPFHIVSVWFADQEIVCGQEKVAEKSNEITAIPTLVESFDFPDHSIISIDAMGCQVDICQKIIDKGADYVISVKENQPTLFMSTLSQIEEENHHSLCYTENKGHGRVEKRWCTAMAVDQKKRDFKGWPGIQAIYAVDADVLTKRRTKETRSLTTRYFVSSVLLPAEDMLTIIRNHWGIETKLHWRLDVTTNEDEACIQDETTAVNVNKLRKFSFNLLNPLKEKNSMASMFRKCGNPTHAIKILDKYFYP